MLIIVFLKEGKTKCLSASYVASFKSFEFSDVTLFLFRVCLSLHKFFFSSPEPKAPGELIV